MRHRDGQIVDGDVGRAEGSVRVIGVPAESAGGDAGFTEQLLDPLSVTLLCSSYRAFEEQRSVDRQMLR
jgi:hypothetical protein